MFVIDCDTLIINDLAQFWNTDIGDKIAGAVLDSSGGEAKRAIGLSEGTPYFNAGILLINLNSWRKNNIQKKCLDLIEQKIISKEMLPFADQDVLNKIFSEEDCWYSCSLRFNFSPTFPYMYMSHRRMVDICRNKQVPSEVDILRAKLSPVIIHEKLWVSNLPVSKNYKQLYFYYHNKNPFGIKIIKMSFLKMLEHTIVRLYWGNYVPTFFYRALKNMK